MLKRIFIDNYKCLQNFELHPGPINLFLGPNGGGKSSVFEVIRKLQTVVSGEAKVSDAFEDAERTKWQNLPMQSFELDIELNSKTWKYQLYVDMSESGNPPKVGIERLLHNKAPLLQFEKGEVQLYKDDGSLGPKYPFDWSQSAVGSITHRGEMQFIQDFKDFVSHFFVVQIDPKHMSSVSPHEERHPSLSMDNFTSWYRNLSQDQGMAFTLTRKFQDVLPGFDYFRFREAGERHRELFAYFKDSDRAPSQAYRFTELSDGQRALFVLYTLIHVMRTKRGILFIDEPENFLALPEIQPWLIELYDLCLQGEGQSLIISHHPELINYLLASPVGFWFERPSNSSVRVRPIVPNGVEGLRVSEIIARGWLLE